MHQIDHIIKFRSNFKCFTETGITSPILDSDHRAIRCKLRLARRLGRKSDLLKCLNYQNLDDEETAVNFRHEVCDNFGESFSSLTSAIQKASLSVLPKRDKAFPGWFKDKKM